jgi:hypothetical protein
MDPRGHVLDYVIYGLEFGRYSAKYNIMYKLLSLISTSGTRLPFQQTPSIYRER